MKIFFRLLLAHLLTDFVFQTNFIANWKKKSFLGVIVHSLIFFIFGLILTWNDLTKVWFDYPIKLTGVWCVTILFVLHMLEDEYRAYNIRHYHIKDNILFFLWDQLIHIVFIFVFSSYFSKWEVEPFVIILCLLIAGSYGLSIVILYIDSLFYTDAIAYNYFQKKVYSIVFRLIIMLFFLLPYKLYIISLLLIPVMLVLNKKIKFLSPIGWLVNTIVAYGLGVTIFLIKESITL